MAKTRSGKKMHNLCENVPSKTKKKTKTYSASDEVTNDKIKIIGILEKVIVIWPKVQLQR